MTIRLPYSSVCASFLLRQNSGIMTRIGNHGEYVLHPVRPIKQFSFHSSLEHISVPRRQQRLGKFMNAFLSMTVSEPILSRFHDMTFIMLLPSRVCVMMTTAIPAHFYIDFSRSKQIHICTNTGCHFSLARLCSRDCSDKT